MNTPFLPTREGCKTAKARPVGCGCTAEANQKYMFGTGDEVVWNRKQQCCCLLSIFLFIYFVLFGIIQWIMFHFATSNCGALPSDYNFPGGGARCLSEKNCTGPEDNLLPRNAIIQESEPSIYGEVFDVMNATSVGTIGGAPVGTWFRTWGPWFYTYTYQDTLNSKATVYMRPTLLGMTGAMSEVKAMRCDGKGDVLKFTEGTAVISNWFREFFHTNTGKTMKMLVNGKRVGEAEETFGGEFGTNSISFRTLSTDQAQTFGSLILKRNEHMWVLKDEWNAPIPYWMTNAVAVNFAFKIKVHVAKTKKSDPVPSFLAALAEAVNPESQLVQHAKRAAQVKV